MPVPSFILRSTESDSRIILYLFIRDLVILSTRYYTYYSEDGINWEKITMVEKDGTVSRISGFRLVFYDGKMFYGIDYKTIYISSNGKKWTLWVMGTRTQCRVNIFRNSYSKCNM